MNSIPLDTFYKDGYKLAFENANSLFKIASLSAKENEFGIACSLSILAAEESIKAIYLIFKYFDDKTEVADFDKIFKNHKTKHEYFPETSSYFQSAVEIFYTKEGLYNYIMDMINRLIPESKRQAFLDEYKIGFDCLKEVQLLDSLDFKFDSKIDIEKEKEWWKNANLEKNRGLYVDKVENAWHDPKSFTKEKYDEVRKHTYYIVEYTEKIVALLDKGIKRGS